ncbi:bifunctional riboflavin kinase/FAD synthetase [Lutibacter sp. B2]|nr:bifunctional riboflavin kinase/FAD synthetase [Lutibacter sp. B2]
MKVITSLDHIKMNANTGIALGNFDGLHIGHQALIVNLVETCKKNNLKSVVYTFSNHPKGLTGKGNEPKRIITHKQKIELLSSLGVDYVVFIEFDEYQMKLDPTVFVRDVLKGILNMAYCIVGFNYKFGYKAQGNVELLEKFKNEYSYDLMVIKALNIQEQVISSTKIREFIRSGNIRKANLFLGRKYSIVGKIVHGKSNGRKFGFPTANIKLDSTLILPSEGVYFTKSILCNKIYNSITNVGFNPTIGSESINVETHILDFDQDIYGKEIEVFFIEKVRDEMKYSSTNDLIAQLHKDIESAKNFFSI